jgi:hypothetical protein
MRPQNCSFLFDNGFAMYPVILLTNLFSDLEIFFCSVLSILTLIDSQIEYIYCEHPVRMTGRRDYLKSLTVINIKAV